MRKPKGLETLTIVLCAVSGAGCGQERLAPDRTSISVSYRQIRGKAKGFHIDTNIPLWELRTKKEIGEEIDLGLRLQWNKGEVGAKPPISAMAGKTEGCFAGIGPTLNYYPLKTRMIGLELGGEYVRAEYEMRGKLGPIQVSQPGKTDALGFNLGLTGDLPLRQKSRASLVWGVGHHWAWESSRGAKANLDGWYLSLGLQINLSPAPRQRRTED